jgi:intradiol ring-cleaving dioxygenase-like protein
MAPIGGTPYVVSAAREGKMTMVKSRYALKLMHCTAFDQHSGRREVMLKTAAVMGSLLLPRFGRAQEPRKPTWMEIIGPFYHARIVTDAEGRYSIKTIKPGAYPTPSGWMRAPHIHFDITRKVTRLVTAMYFEGEPLNDQDRVLKTSFNPKSQMTQADRADASSEPGTLKANWDIVLITG